MLIFEMKLYQLNTAIELWGIDLVCQFDSVFAADLCSKKQEAIYNLPKFKNRK